MFQSSGIFTHYLHAILKAIELKFQQLVSGSLPFFFPVPRPTIIIFSALGASLANLEPFIQNDPEECCRES